MYFAADIPQAAQLAAQIATRVASDPALSWYALVDGAFDYGRPPLAGFEQRVPTYDAEGYEAILTASPYLIALASDDATVLLAQVRTLLRHRGNRPMLSFIGSAASAATLNADWIAYATAATPDDDEYLLRFADTRVLPSLATHLRPAYWRGITLSVKAWFYVDRAGLLAQLELGMPEEVGSIPDPRVQAAGRFVMSQGEFAALVSAAEPDAVIRALERSNPDILPPQNRALCYDQVAAACRCAGRHRIEAFPDIVALATYALLAGAEALTAPVFVALLDSRAWESGRLIDAIVEYATDVAAT